MATLSFLRRTLGIALLVLAWPGHAAEPVTVERASALYAEPRTDAAQVAQLKEGTPGEVVDKRGVWLNLRTAEGTGWTFSFNVRFPSQAASQSGGGGSFLGRLFAPRRASVAGTSTIGIRGLDEADLRDASFSAAQMQLFDQYVATREAAQLLADERGLAPAPVEYLEGTQQ